MSYGEIINLFCKTKGFTLKEFENWLFWYFDDPVYYGNYKEEFYDERDLIED